MIKRTAFATSFFVLFSTGCGGSDFRLLGEVVPDDASDTGNVDNDAVEVESADALPLIDVYAGDIVGDTSDVSGDAGGDNSADGTDASPDSPDSPPPSDSPAPRKRIFTSSQTYLANMGGLAGADAKCQGLADAAKIGGTYRAWLSDSKTSAKSRLTHATVPYVLVNGTVVAADWTDLVSGALSHDIDMTELGTVSPDGKSYYGFKRVWTATETSGAMYDLTTTGVANSSCWDWTYTAEPASGEPYTVAAIGSWDTAGSKWTYYTSSTCRSPTQLSIYCVEQ